MELLSPIEMAEADRLTIAGIEGGGYALMLRASGAVAQAVMERYREKRSFDILCGPGNNGGDGYVVAGLLARQGYPVRLWREMEPIAGTDAAAAAEACPLPRRSLAGFRPEPESVVIDAMFGAGLSKPLKGSYLRAAEAASQACSPVVAIDLPSGVSGDSGAVLGTAAVRADLTVTFFRKKPGHLLYPGRALCGDIVVADIGIPPAVLKQIQPRTFENVSRLWRAVFPVPAVDAHKYQRGHVAVLSGGPASTGAARLAAMGAARAGAGAVTLLSPDTAMAVNAAHLTAIMLRRTEDEKELATFLEARKPSAMVAGPGLGTEERSERLLLCALEKGRGVLRGVVYDADAITLMARKPETYARLAEAADAAALVITPHEGEFRRLFPDIAAQTISKLEKARQAARRANCVVVYKGPDTVIADPDGRAAVNGNGSPWLATAGSGDVLAGICAGLMAQRMPAFEAACAAVWLHAEAARRFGPGLIAEDLPAALLPVLRDVIAAGAPPLWSS